MKKLIPFTLERWQQGNCTPKTADGREVKHLTNFETNDEFPLGGAVSSQKETWKLNGCYNRSGASHNNDLMLEVDCEVVYVSLFNNAISGMHSVINRVSGVWEGHSNFIKEIKVEL